jgi:hypothetical protein
MRIIQSFWTKPFVNPSSKTFESRFQGGFIEDKQFIYTWALSLLSIKEQFPQVHLITDQLGKKAWIDFFEFPYDSYSIELTALNDFPTDFWAAGKLYSYSKVKEPFIHIDVDVILGRLFDHSKLDSDLLVEFHYDDQKLNRYNTIIEKLVNSNIKMSSECMQMINQKDFNYNDYNLGITGGNDFAFYNRYAKKASSDLQKNLPLADPKDKITASFFNCFFEQFYFYNQVKKESRAVTKLIENTILEDIDYQKCKIESGINNCDFIHLHGGFKRIYPTLAEKWLKEIYPSFYQHINSKLAYINSTKIN